MPWFKNHILGRSIVFFENLLIHPFFYFFSIVVGGKLFKYELPATALRLEC